MSVFFYLLFCALFSFLLYTFQFFFFMFCSFFILHASQPFTLTYFVYLIFFSPFTMNFTIFHFFFSDSHFLIAPKLKMVVCVYYDDVYDEFILFFCNFGVFMLLYYRIFKFGLQYLKHHLLSCYPLSLDTIY